MSMVFKLTSVKGIAPSQRVPAISLFPGGYDAEPHTKLLLKLDEGEGIRAVDYSDYRNNGEISGAQWTSGKYGYGLHFDGINDYVVIPHHETLNLRNQGAGDFCIEAWVKIQFSFIQMIALKQGAYYLGLNQIPGGETRIKFRAGIWVSGNKREISTDWNYALNEWLHVTFQRRQDGYLTLVVNGNEDVVSEISYGPADINENVLYIGRSTSDQYFQGDIDEVRFSDCYREISDLDPNR